MLALVKVGFFTWEVVWGKILTLDHLRRRGWPLRNQCILYKSEKELLDHILSNNVKQQGVYGILFSLFGIALVNPSSPRGEMEICASMLMLDCFVGEIS